MTVAISFHTILIIAEKTQQRLVFLSCWIQTLKRKTFVATMDTTLTVQLFRRLSQQRYMTQQVYFYQITTLSVVRQLVYIYDLVATSEVYYTKRGRNL